MLTELEMLTKFWKSPFFQKGTFLSIKYSKGLFLYITKKVCERTISVEDHNKSKKKKKKTDTSCKVQKSNRTKLKQVIVKTTLK